MLKFVLCALALIPVSVTLYMMVRTSITVVNPNMDVLLLGFIITTTGSLIYSFFELVKKMYEEKVQIGSPKAR